MPELHFLNVDQGDSIIIVHASGRCTMYDICAGNLEPPTILEAFTRAATLPTVQGNFRMCERPTNPIEFLPRIGRSSVFRFILSHPDMDHLDGFNNLMNSVSVWNFWDSGARKEKPDFPPYVEADWDRYVSVRDGKESVVTVVKPKADSRFQFANKNEEGKSGGDGLYVLAPNQQLIDDANASGNFNDASYVVLYRSMGGKILLPGDAHDKTWEFVLKNFEDDVRDCSLLIAPHHGRKSDRSYEFLDVVNPKLTLFGCAPSEYLAYGAWNYRNLLKITNNQAGNVSVTIREGALDVFVENETFAVKVGGRVDIKNKLGYYYVTTI